MAIYNENYIENFTYTKEMKIIEPNNEIESGYGLDNTLITDKDIEELKKGNLLWFNDGEYSHTISYKGENK